LTMINGYIATGISERESVFDLFYRKNQYIEYAVAAGLETAIEYIKNIRFSQEDIEYLKSLNIFSDKFFEVIRDFKFTGDIYAIREGEVIFPNEPILTVKAPLYQAQFIETALLNIINHQTLIATKAAKITQQTEGAVMEFGLRRAQGPDAGIYGARAAIIGGCGSTSNVLAGKMFDIKVSGTHSHSWVMSFDKEIDAFRAYAEVHPDTCVLLVDTYDTLKSGVPNAIKVFDELKEKGHKPLGIRLDSGDLAYLSKRARQMLDDAGHKDVKIVASGDIDEYILSSLIQQGARIDTWGIGTKLITSAHNPSLGGVYKLAAIKEGDEWIPKLKISDTEEKITNPALKTTYRIYDEEGLAAADLICLKDETFDTDKPLTIFHPIETWKKTTFHKHSMRDLMTDIIRNGELVYDFPKLEEVKAYTKKSLSEFSEEHKRLINPHIYKVDLSDKLYALKHKLIHSEH